MLTLPLLAAISMFSMPCDDPGVCINVNGPCSIVISPTGDMTLSNGKEISITFPEAAMESAAEEWDRLGCAGR